MKIYCMSDIHGCLAEFEEALSLVIDQLDEPDTMLCLLGDYIHGGADNYGVLDLIMSLQDRYGSDRVVALLGNHEEFILLGDSTINHMIKTFDEEWLSIHEPFTQSFLHFLQWSFSVLKNETPGINQTEVIRVYLNDK